MENNHKKLTFKIIFRAVAVISALLALFCFITPAARKSNSLSVTGNSALDAMTPAATVISYYSADNIAKLAEKPVLDENCKYIAGLLAQLNTQQGYEKMYILSRSADKKLSYLIDGSYRDNGKAGTDYFAPAAAYPTDNGYKAVKSVADKLYSNKITAGYANEIITNQNHKNVVVSCLPIYGGGHTTVAVLCIESDPGNTAFHMIGQINLYYVGWGALAVFALCVAFILLKKKFIAYRAQRAADKESGKADAILIDDVTVVNDSDAPPEEFAIDPEIPVDPAEEIPPEDSAI